MTSIRGVMHVTFLPSHCIHQSQFTLCANLSWPFILKNPLTSALSLIFAVPFAGLFFCLPKYTFVFSHIFAPLFLHQSPSGLLCFLHSRGARWQSSPRTSAQSSPKFTLYKRICPLYYFLFSTACLHFEGGSAVLLVEASKGKCNLSPYKDVLAKNRHMHQEKKQEGIYTAMEMCDEFYTESKLMLQLIFFSSTQDWKPIIILLINRECQFTLWIV